jgi:hypothetical protein
LCEASLTHMPSSLRDLFVQVLIHGEASEPLALWTKYAEELAQDHLRRARTPAAGLDAALHLLLQSHDRRTTDFGLPEPAVYDAEAFSNSSLRQALAFDVDEATVAAEQ